MRGDIIANRRATTAFIHVDPEEISFIPRVKDRQPAGGFAWRKLAARPPQTVTFVEPPSNPVPTITLDGVERRVEMMIVAEWDAAIARYDVFTHAGRDWEVVEIFYSNGYETRALVSGRG